MLAGCGSFGSRGGGDFVPLKQEKEKAQGGRRRWKPTAPVGGKMRELKKRGGDDEWADFGPMRASEEQEREARHSKPEKNEPLPALSAGTGAKGGALAAGAPAGGGAVSLEGATLASGGAEALPTLSSLDNTAIKGMMEKRLDIGGYRVQLSETEDFAAPIFDGQYDIMQPIDLMDELAKAGIKTEREAYWVRIAFIDLLAVEEPFTNPRLYGLDKRRREAVEEE